MKTCLSSSPGKLLAIALALSVSAGCKARSSASKTAGALSAECLATCQQLAAKKRVQVAEYARSMTVLVGLGMSSNDAEMGEMAKYVFKEVAGANLSDPQGVGRVFQEIAAPLKPADKSLFVVETIDAVQSNAAPGGQRIKPSDLPAYTAVSTSLLAIANGLNDAPDAQKAYGKALAFSIDTAAASAAVGNQGGDNAVIGAVRDVIGKANPALITHPDVSKHVASTLFGVSSFIQTPTVKAGFEKYAAAQLNVGLGQARMEIAQNVAALTSYVELATARGINVADFSAKAQQLEAKLQSFQISTADANVAGMKASALHNLGYLRSVVFNAGAKFTPDQVQRIDTNTINKMMQSAKDLSHFSSQVIDVSPQGTFVLHGVLKGAVPR